MTTDLCDDCKSSGLPILPVRYVPVPDAVSQTLPVWAGAARVRDVPLGAGFHYALRILRGGYVYLFFSKNVRGSNQWECYMVTEDGLLIKQPDPAMAPDTPAAGMTCTRQGHNNVRLHHLVIEKPEKCGAAWIAFSERKWSKETIKAYTTDGRLRDARMQTIQPSAMARGAKHSHGAVATAAALEEVIEYSASFSTASLPHGAVAPTFSHEDGRFSAALLSRVITRYPWHQRQGQAASSVKLMIERAKKGDGTSNSPHVLALWDAVGMAHELNGFRNDAAGWLKRYGDERELQISGLQAIEGLKKALDKRISDGWDEISDNTRRMPDHEESGLRARAVMRYAKGDPAALGRPLAVLDEEFKAGKIAEAAYRAKRSQIISAHSSHPAAMEAEYAKIDQHRVTRSTTRAANLHENKRFDMAKAWGKYDERLDASALRTFRHEWEKLLSQVDGLIDQRTIGLVNWLEAPLFIDTLEDFHAGNLNDGNCFVDVVGEATFGIGSCERGAAKLDQWIREAKASFKTNLVWRAIALNQQEAVAEVDAALKVVYGPRIDLNSQSMDNIGGQVKWNKLADLVKKSLTAFNTQMKAVNDSGSGIKPVESTRGLEKLFMTVGGRWLRPFNWAVDTANEITLRSLLMVRSGVEPLAAKALGAWDAVHSAADREMLLRRLLNQDYYLSAAAKAHYEETAKKWAALRESAEVPDAKRKSFNAARDARLALVVAVFEAFNLYKTSAKAAKEPGSEKVQAQLTAAKFATTAAAIDVLSNMVKGLATAGDKAASYQVLKLGGGALTAIASGYGAALDFNETGKAVQTEDYRMALLFGGRASFQVVSVTLTALTALSYCSPLIETFGAKFGQRLVGQAASLVAKRLLLARAALIFASLEVSIFLLAISAIIWYFEDEALQKWADRCAFGAKRKSLPDAFSTAEIQIQRYGEALKEAL